MSRAELVVRALGPLEKAGDAALLAEGREFLVASGEELPGIRLVAHVPHDLVGRRVEFAEQRDGQLDAAEARADVAAGDGHGLDQAFADFLGQDRELILAQFPEVRGSVDACQ